MYPQQVWWITKAKGISTDAAENLRNVKQYAENLKLLAFLAKAQKVSRVCLFIVIQRLSERLAIVSTNILS